MSFVRSFPALAAYVLCARDVLAVDAFEIQVYDGTANRPGVPGLELHVNRVFDGTKTSEPPELPLHHQTHLTLEPSLGVTPFLELGGYLQTAFRADGTFDYAGTKLRAKFVTPEGWRENVRLGVNLELSVIPERYEASRWGAEIRPIAAWENELWLFAINPIVGVPLTSDPTPEFEPAAMAKVKLLNVVALGVEYYSSFGRVSAPSPWHEELQYLYEAVDVLNLPHVEINAGVGEGLTAASNAFVAKCILGYSWERDTPGTP